MSSPTNPAIPDHPIHDLLRSRWSPLAFAETAVPAADLRAIFEAARWASSSYNEQPWRYVVGDRDRDPDTWTQVLDCLVAPNQAWARTAPVLFLAFASTRYRRNDKPNDKCWHDLGQANFALAVEAAARGWQVHPMGGFVAETARAHFAPPEGVEPHVAFALGAPGSPERLPDNLQERAIMDRSRNPLSDMVFGGRWGSAPASLAR